MGIGDVGVGLKGRLRPGSPEGVEAVAPVLERVSEELFGDVGDFPGRLDRKSVV